jgi:hypothetical protein
MTVTATMFAPKTRNRRWRYALLVWFFASIAFATPSFVNAAAAAAGHDHDRIHAMHAMHDDAPNSGQSQIPDMPVGHDHATMNCCMVSCVATCFGTLQNGAFINLRSASAYLFLADDPLLRSLYLDSDPPVPKA